MLPGYSGQSNLCSSIELITLECPTPFQIMPTFLIVPLKYLSLVFAGLFLIILCSTMQPVEPLQSGEYFYSGFLRNHYTFLTAFMFFVVGLSVGYYMHLNPWYSGLSLILIFPLVSLYEAFVYRESHHLLPFEFMVHFLFALPAILGVYLGRFVTARTAKSRNI